MRGPRLRSYFGPVDLANEQTLHILHRGVLSTASVAIQGLLRFLYSVLIGRLLGPVLLAATNSAISAAQFASLLWPAASGSAATKFVARARGANDIDLARQTAQHLARSTLAVSLVLAVPIGLFSYFFQARNDLVTAVLVALLTVSLSNYNFVRGVFFAVGLVSRAVVWDTICAVLGLGLLVAVIFLRWPGLLLAPLVVAYGIYAVAGWPRGGGRLRSRALRSEINGFIMWSSIGSLATGGFLQLSMVIAHAHATPVASGMYAAALSLATPASMIGSVLSLLLFPAMAHATGRNDLTLVRQQADTATRGLVTVLGAAFGVLVLVARPLVELVFGTTFRDAVPVLIILLSATFLVTIGVGAVNVLQAGTRRSVRIPALLSGAGMLVGLLMMFILTDMSVIGVAIGYLCGAAVIGAGPLIVVWIRERMLWGSLAVRLMCGAAVMAALIIGSELAGGSYWIDALNVVLFLALWLLMMRREFRMIARLRTTARA